jgi:UDP-2,3-diacylglucosamine pyrophosphatase LpxH
MIKWKVILLFVAALPFAAHAQLPAAENSANTEMNFISDTQQPMLVEKIILKPTHNKKATALLFSQIKSIRPQSVYMLGDIVSLGFNNRKWRKVDAFLDSCRSGKTTVCGLLGNHDVMGRAKKGERNFNKRFPDNVRTGYVSVTDSVAVILLNSNFKKLSATDNQKQINWYQTELNSLDTSEAIKAIIVTCHHAPYTNSIIVGSNTSVQQNFVPAFISSKKAKLFITGHAHDFEHFKMQGKDFLVIGGGGGLHQPLSNATNKLSDLAAEYKPLFHYLSVKRTGDDLSVTSHFLSKDFTGFGTGHSFITNQPEFTATKNYPNKSNNQPTF